MIEKLRQQHPKLYKHFFTVTTFSKLLALSLFIILPFGGFYLGMKYQQLVTVSIPTVSQVQKTASLITPAISFTPTPTIALIGKITNDASGNWKTYTNTQLGFSMQFPAKGWIGYVEKIGECGNGFLEASNGVDIDDFFIVNVHKGYNSIQSYLDSVISGIEKIFGPQNVKFQTTSINISNADEASSITQIGNYPDEVRILYIVRKNNTIYDIQLFSGNYGPAGCHAPVDNKNFTNPPFTKSWDFSTNFKIL